MPASQSVIMRIMLAAHAYLGYVLLVLMLAYSMGNLVAWKEARRMPRLEWLFVVIILAMAAQSLQGAWLLWAGHRPSEWLHIVYTAASFVTFLGARGVATAVSATQSRLVVAVGCAAATLLLVRATSTG